MDATKVCPKCAATYEATVVFCPEDGSPLQSSDGDPLIGQVVADRYRMIARIGEGGMGQVYLAEHVHMRRRCAVKFLTPDLVGNEFAMKRFMREAENASRIDHPNVVTMYDFGEAAGGTVYLAMEFVDGESLRRRIERQGNLPTELIASVIRQTASALQAAHTLQIVHRDLKPDNIMLIDRGDEVRVKVVDFGIAKARDPKQKVTVTGAIVGTPDYMSPEQVSGDETDGRSDQYALALVAVKMLTGKLPFANTGGVESLTSRLFTAPTPLRTLRAEVVWPQQLQDVVNRALSPQPDDRFPSVMDFTRAFDRALSAMDGAVAATVPEIVVSDIVPPTRVSAPAAAGGSRATPRRPAWLMAAAVGVVAIGSGVFYAATRPGQAPVAPYSLEVGDSARLRSDAGVTQQSAPDSGQADSAPSTATSAIATPPPAVEPPATGTRIESQAPAPEASAPVKAAPKDSTPASTPAATNAGAAATQPAGQPATTPVPPVTPPADPPKPAGLTSAEVSAEIARVRPLMTPETPRADVEGAIASLDRLLPKVGQRSDSIRVLYSKAQAHVLVEDQAAACRSLSRALGLASGSRLEETIARTSRDLSCP